MSDEEVHNALRDAIGWMEAGIQQTKRIGRSDVRFELRHAQTILATLQAAETALDA
jgi:hypothetical protein